MKYFELSLPPIEQIIDNFSFIDDWEDRYSYIIDLGKQLSNDNKKLYENNKDLYNEKYRVNGCVSQVWLKTFQTKGDNPILYFISDSDAHIVKGLIAIMLSAFSGKSASYIQNYDIKPLFDKLNLTENLTTQRNNGILAFLQKIKSEAEKIQ